MGMDHLNDTINEQRLRLVERFLNRDHMAKHIALGAIYRLKQYAKVEGNPIDQTICDHIDPQPTMWLYHVKLWMEQNKVTLAHGTEDPLLPYDDADKTPGYCTGDGAVITAISQKKQKKQKQKHQAKSKSKNQQQKATSIRKKQKAKAKKHQATSKSKKQQQKATSNSKKQKTRKRAETIQKATRKQPAAGQISKHIFHNIYHNVFHQISHSQEHSKVHITATAKSNKPERNQKTTRKQPESNQKATIRKKQLVSRSCLHTRWLSYTFPSRYECKNKIGCLVVCMHMYVRCLRWSL